MKLEGAKDQVLQFWEDASCGEALHLSSLDEIGYREQARRRYELEPYIEDFAGFAAARGKKVLEIGVGLGADHERFAAAGAELHGVDLTSRAVEHVLRRFEFLGLTSDLKVGDAENLDFADDTFDLVYSWGVIHHSPDTAGAAREILRVLKPGGRFKVMIYHYYSMVGFMLWLRYALARGRPLTSLTQVYSHCLESPGTKAYTLDQAKALFAGAVELRSWSVLTHGDLLTSEAGQRHEGLLLALARRLWPRFIIRRLFPNCGLFLLIEGRKPRPDVGATGVRLQGPQ